MSTFGECLEKRSFAPAAMRQSTTARSCPRFSRRGSLQVMTWLFSGLVLVRVGKYLHVSSHGLSLSSNMAGGANQRFVLRESGKTVSLRPLATMRRVTSCHISHFSDLKVPLFPGLFQVTWRWRSVMSIRSTRKEGEVSHARRRWGLGRITGSFLCAHYPMCWVFSRCFFPTFVRPSASAGIRRPVVPDAWWFPAHRQQSFVATKRPHGTARISAIATKWKSVWEEVPQNVQAARMIVSVLKCRTSKQHWSKIRRWTPICTSASWKRSRCLASREQRASRRTSGQCK